MAFWHPEWLSEAHVRLPLCVSSGLAMNKLSSSLPSSSPSLHRCLSSKKSTTSSLKSFGRDCVDANVRKKLAVFIRIFVPMHLGLSHGGGGGGAVVVEGEEEEGRQREKERTTPFSTCAHRCTRTHASAWAHSWIFEFDRLQGSRVI